MLSKPDCGWSTIAIGDWSDRCSYLTDVPYDLARALELGVRTHKPTLATFDAEGWEYIIVFEWLDTHIISNKDEEYKLYSFPVGRDQLAAEFISDIRENLDGWASWNDFDRHRMSDDEFNERKADLSVYCDMIEKRIPSDDWVCVYRKGENEDA